MDIIATIVTSLALLFTLFSIVKAVLDYRMKRHLIRQGLIGYEHIHSLLTKKQEPERMAIIKYIIILFMFGTGLLIASFMGEQNALVAISFILIWMASGLTIYLYFIKRQHQAYHQRVVKKLEDKSRA